MVVEITLKSGRKVNLTDDDSNINIFFKISDSIQRGKLIVLSDGNQAVMVSEIESYRIVKD